MAALLRPESFEPSDLVTVRGTRSRAPHTQAPAGRCRHSASAGRRLRLVAEPALTQAVLAPEPAAPPAPVPVVVTTRPRAGARRGRAPLARSVYLRRRVGVVLAVLTAVALALQLASLVSATPDAPLTAVATGPAMASPSAGAAPDGRAVPADEVVVRPGDTLWSIAARIAPDGDPRPVVDALAERLGGTTIVPGQRIAVDGIRPA